MAIFVLKHNYKAVFLQAKGVKKNLNSSNSCNSMIKVIKLHYFPPWRENKGGFK